MKAGAATRHHVGIVNRTGRAPHRRRPAKAPPSAKGKVIGPNNQPQVGVPVTIEGPLGKTVAITDKSGMWSIYKLPAARLQSEGNFR